MTNRFILEPVKALSIPICVDALAMINRQTKISKLYEILIETVVRYLKLFELQVLNKIKHNINGISTPQTFHFYPENCGHFITQIYLKNKSENDLLSRRHTLHKSLLLNENAPIFRRANSYTFKNNVKNFAPLINPHIGLKPTNNGN